MGKFSGAGIAGFHRANLSALHQDEARTRHAWRTVRSNVVPALRMVCRPAVERKMGSDGEARHTKTWINKGRSC